MARHAAVRSSISNGFDLGGMACCIQHSVFNIVPVCARECAVGETGVVRAEAIFLGAVCCMQARRRCILDGVGFSVQRIFWFALPFT